MITAGDAHRAASLLSCCMTSKHALTLLAMVTIGCGPETGDATTSAESTAADTTMATGEPTMATGEPTAGDTDALSCQPPPLVGEACDPAGETKGSWYLEVGGEGFFEPFDAMCSVDSVVDGGETQTLTLACGGEVVRLDMPSAAPHVAVPVAAGAMVHMQVTDFPTLEVQNHAFALRDADERLLAAGLRNAILPQPAPLKVAPLTFELLATDCEALDNDFVVMQRAGLSVTMDGITAVVFDGNTANLGPQDGFQILVSRATRELCVADSQFNGEPWGVDALVVFTPEG